MKKQEMKEALKEVLEENGVITPLMTLKEVISQIGRFRYEKAVKSGLINRIKGEGKNSKVQVKRSEFSELIKKALI